LSQLQLANVIQIDPLPVLLSEVFFSNLGGTATLIGDPPNIIIAEALGLSFNDFIKYLAPCVLIAIVPCCVFIALYFRKVGPIRERERDLTSFCCVCRLLAHTWCRKSPRQ
jgi:Na+/H+ antiporter NhaD/arsenite permease-like protein